MLCKKSMMRKIVKYYSFFIQFFYLLIYKLNKMKKVLLSVLLICCLVSCKKTENQQIKNVKSEIKIDSSLIKKKEAIKLLNEIDGWMKKGITKELSTSKVNDKINPLMKKYELKLSELNKKDSISVQEYRLKQINEMINLQMQQ